jgi:Tol biopolymer transport system component/DNA-binding winged helix-turn-helix (wHTH) protein
MGESDKRFYEFGAFRLHAAEYVLLRDGQVVPLTPKVFQTLLVLVENSGHVVHKDELYKQVWQDAFVEETNLTKNISILRKILSEGDGERPFIETVPKRGYRFVFPVRKISAEENGNNSRTATIALSPNGLDQSTTSSVALPRAITPADLERRSSTAENIFPQIKKHKYIFAGVLGVVAVLIAGVGFGLYKAWFPKKTGISLAPTQMTRLTSSGRVYKAVISADGKWLVYIDYDGENQSLWLQQVGVPGSNHQIAPAAAIYQGVAISPDGNYVYYTLLQRDNWDGVLYRVPILGGEARQVLTDINGPVALSPDGKKIAFYRWADDEDRLMVANTDGTGQRQLVARGGNESLVYGTHGPSWSPDSKTLLTAFGTLAPQLSMTVAAVSAETGALNLFSQKKFQSIADIAWLPNGQGVLVSATDQFAEYASWKIWQISYPSGNAQRITNDLNSYQTISLAADSNTLATVQTETQGNLWIASLNDLAHISPITTGRNLASFPSWAPDGKVIYSLSSAGNTDLYMVDPREGSAKQLTVNSGNNYHPAVSPDGRHIVFSSDRSGVIGLWRIDIDGQNPKQLTNQFSTKANFAPDGRTIAYMSSANSHTISTISIDGGEPRQLTKNDSGHPAFSPDGTLIACLYSEKADTKYGIAIIPATGGPPVKTFPLPAGFSFPIKWMPDGKAIMYPLRRRGVGNLWVQPIEGGEPKQLTNFTSDLIHSYDISRDGQQFVFSRGTKSSDVVLFTGIRE